MNQSKVLFIIINLGGGGAEKVFVNIANGFVEAGNEVWLLLGENFGVYFDILDKRVNVEELKATTMLDFYKKLPNFLKNKGFTHVFTASDYITAATWLVKKHRRFDFKFIATLHYDLPFQLSILPMLNRIWLTWLNKFIIAKSDKMVAVSKGVKIGFENVVGKKLNNLITIYNPVFSDKIFELASQSVVDPMPGRIKLISIGRLMEQKNPMLLLTAFKLLHKNIPDAHLYILGAGPLQTQMEKYLVENKISDFVHFKGFQKNPFKFLSKADVLVLSSIYEGLGNVIIEALALGVNVVSTDCPSGPAEILDYGRFGWLSPVNDPEALAKLIEEALSKPISAKILQDRSKMFTESVIVSQYLKLIE